MRCSPSEIFYIIAWCSRWFCSVFHALILNNLPFTAVFIHILSAWKRQLFIACKRNKSLKIKTNIKAFLHASYFLAIIWVWWTECHWYLDRIVILYVAWWIPFWVMNNAADYIWLQNNAMTGVCPATASLLATVVSNELVDLPIRITAVRCFIIMIYNMLTTEPYQVRKLVFICFIVTWNVFFSRLTSFFILFVPK